MQIDSLVLPRMLIQPLLDNAITHGLSTVDDGTLSLCIARQGSDLHVTVQDTGKGMPPETLAALQEQLQSTPPKNYYLTQTHHIALINIQQRIRTLFGAPYGLNVAANEPSGVTVTLRIPFEQE